MTASIEKPDRSLPIRIANQLIELDLKGLSKWDSAEGVAAAAFQMPNPKGTLIIRGVTDFADEKKSDEWREYAAN